MKHSLAVAEAEEAEVVVVVWGAAEDSVAEDADLAAEAVEWVEDADSAAVDEDLAVEAVVWAVLVPWVAVQVV